MMTVSAEEVGEVLVQELVDLQSKTVQADRWTIFTFVDHTLHRPRVGGHFGWQMALPRQCVGFRVNKCILNIVIGESAVITTVQRFVQLNNLIQAGFIETEAMVTLY